MAVGLHAHGEKIHHPQVTFNQRELDLLYGRAFNREGYTAVALSCTGKHQQSGTGVPMQETVR